MKPVWMYLDEAQARGLAANDSDIAAKLGVTKASVCEWRKGRSAPGEDAAAKLAELLEKPEVMAECAAARAKTPEGRRMWERLARIAAAAVVVVGVVPADSHAASQQARGIDAMQLSRTYCFQKCRSTYRRGKKVFAALLRIIFQQSEAAQNIAVTH